MGRGCVWSESDLTMGDRSSQRDITLLPLKTEKVDHKPRNAGGF